MTQKAGEDKDEETHDGLSDVIMRVTVRRRHGSPRSRHVAREIVTVTLTLRVSELGSLGSVSLSSES